MVADLAFVDRAVFLRQRVLRGCMATGSLMFTSGSYKGGHEAFG